MRALPPAESKRWALAGLAAVLLAGCATPADRPPEPPRPSEDSEPVGFNATFFLKAPARLDPAPPSKATPDRIASTPTVNGYANEDLLVLGSAPTNVSWNVTRARLTIDYEVDQPAVDPFANSSDPTSARALVFWLGSQAFYPNSVSTFGDPILLPDRQYRVQVDFALPAGGWQVLAGERLQLAIATLVLSHPNLDLKFLVDAISNPSRLDLVGFITNATRAASVQTERTTHEIAANSGLFTGATRDRVPSTVRVAIEMGRGESLLEVRVRFLSNAGAKSDLDLTLLDRGGRAVAASTTPYQSETIRLLKPNLDALGPGRYTAEIEAYSGVNTRFELVLARS